MKKAMNLIFAMAAFVALSACEMKGKELREQNNDWKRSNITGRSESGKEIPTSYIFDCRKLSDGNRTHYYYNVVADPKGKTTTNEEGKKETSYSNAEFRIELFEVGVYGNATLPEGLVSVDVDFKIVEVEPGIVEAVVIANQNTVDTFQEAYKNDSYFNHVKVGDEILRMANNPFQRTNASNLTETPLPGTTKGDGLECR